MVISLRKALPHAVLVIWRKTSLVGPMVRFTLFCRPLRESTDKNKTISMHSLDARAETRTFCMKRGSPTGKNNLSPLL